MNNPVTEHSVDATRWATNVGVCTLGDVWYAEMKHRALPS